VNLRFPLAALAAAAILAAAGCGDSGDDNAGESTTTAAPTPTQAEQPTPAGKGVDTSKKPKVTVPQGDPPAGLQIKDLKEGDGPTAASGSTVTVQYVGVAYSTGKQFDASWDRGQPLTFPLGAGQVIGGWDQGVAGMKVGGRRELIIPPDLAYGAGGHPPDIKPNETLIFVIDLLKVG
jgi:FKBP-type peptidyl-prolyl cis-trans isomerase